MRLVLTLLLLTITSAGIASPGHDHGPAESASNGVAAPRFGTHSDLFELVGVLEAAELVLYLDRYADNEPITAAEIAVSGEALKAAATAAPDGTFRVKADALAKPGRHALVFTIVAAGEQDLLEGTLEVPERGAIGAAHADTAWLARWPYFLVLLGAIGVTALLLRRRK
jgi:hypothetical protein